MKTVRTVYISGPMTGVPDFNFPAFNAAADRWRKSGWTIINPAENFDGRTDLPRQEYMKEDLKGLLRAEGIALLPGATSSRGAMLEMAVALELDLPFFNAETMAPIPSPVISIVLGVVASQEEVAGRPNPLREASKAWAVVSPADEQSVSKEAHDLVYGDRQKSYGHPYDDYVCTSGLWEVFLGLPLGFIGPEKAAIMMSLMKISRASRLYKRDNYVDLCGYAECAFRIHQKIEELEARQSLTEAAAA